MKRERVDCFFALTNNKRSYLIADFAHSTICVTEQPRRQRGKDKKHVRIGTANGMTHGVKDEEETN